MELVESAPQLWQTGTPGSMQPAVPAPATRRRKFGRRVQPPGRRAGYGMMAPYMAHMALFFGYPLVFSFVLVFHRWDVITPMEFVGMKNFARLAQDDLFFRSLMNTGIFLGLHIPLQIVVALFFAEFLNRKIRAMSFFRVIYFLPVIVSGVVVTLIFQQMFAFDEGFLNNLLLSVGAEPVPWLVSPYWAMPSIALMATWKNVGLYIILFLAGLQGINDSLYEAADVEGASRWQKWMNITLPMLNPMIVTVVLLSTIGGFSLFIEPYVLTGGGPLDSTLSAMLYIYNQAFYFNHMGYAATLGFVFAMIIFAVVWLQRRFVEADTWKG
jgi:multiple sugar transport system permease protein